MAAPAAAPQSDPLPARVTLAPAVRAHGGRLRVTTGAAVLDLP